MSPLAEPIASENQSHVPEEIFCAERTGAPRMGESRYVQQAK
jgi:hypothetical protein